MPGILSLRKITVKGAPSGCVAKAMAQAPPLTLIFPGKTSAPMGGREETRLRQIRTTAAILTPVSVQSISAIITAATPLLIGTISGVWAIMRVRGSKADRLLRIMRDETELMDKLPNDSAAVRELKIRIDDAARQYAELRRRQSQLRRDPFGIVLGAIFSLVGIGLATYASCRGGAALLWDILAIPLMLFGIPGFFYELSGGKSREKDASKPVSRAVSVDADHQG